MAAIELHHISKQFPGGVTAVDDCTLSISSSEYLVVLGPSGCGKTTLLRLIAGLDRPDEGLLRIDARDMTGVRPHLRGLSMIFQDSALYPHMTVRRNLAFPLRTRGLERAEIARRVEALSELLRISALLDRKPGELSGGERQRAALGRALIIHPRALLLDEPLSHLDAHLRDDLRRELKRIHHELQSTVIHVTHDQDEAIELGERIAVMAEGRLQQVGTREELMARPANRFVAGFLSRPCMSFVQGLLRQSPSSDGSSEELMVLERAGGSIMTLPIERDSVPDAAVDREVVLGIPPDAISVTSGGDGHCMTVTVRAIQRKVKATFVAGTLDGEVELIVRWPGGRSLPGVNEKISVLWQGGSVWYFEPGPFGAVIDSCQRV